MPGHPVHHHLEFTQTHVHRVGDGLLLCHPLSSCLQSLPLSESSNESTLCMRWPKYWSFSFTISPSNEHPGLTFRMDWLYLLVDQGTLKSLLQHYSSKPSILWHSAFLIVQFSCPYDYWKNHSLDWMDLCWQSNVSAFEYALYVGHNFPSKE